jgi:hypothetical protein
VRTGGLEATAAELEVGADHERHVRVVGGHRTQRGRARTVRRVPLADGQQRFDPIRGQNRVVGFVASQRGEAFLGKLRRRSWPAEHRQRVGEGHVGAVQGVGISGGELDRLRQVREAVVTPAQVCEVAAERRQRSQLRLARAHPASELEGLLAERERFVVAPQERQTVRERLERSRTLSGRRLRGHERDSALEGAEEGVAPAALKLVGSQALVQDRRARPVARADERDRSSCELHSARRVARLAGEFRGPLEQLVEAQVDPAGGV